MRIGTLSCYLFGHKFAGWYTQGIDPETKEYWSKYLTFNTCIRCGIDKPKKD